MDSEEGPDRRLGKHITAAPAPSGSSHLGTGTGVGERRTCRLTLGARGVRDGVEDALRDEREAERPTPPRFSRPRRTAKTIDAFLRVRVGRLRPRIATAQRAT